MEEQRFIAKEITRPLDKERFVQKRAELDRRDIEIINKNADRLNEEAMDVQAFQRNKMEYDTYILVDYENVQDINMDMLNEKTKMVIIVGENQHKIPLKLIQKTQPYGDSIEWLQIKGNGKNALDFFIAYFLGYFISTKSDKEYIVYSKDTGYDILIEYLKLKNINVKRIVSFDQLNNDGCGVEE
jgi:hypothetical protein